MEITGTGQKANTYDAIVVGSGISGGWAAKELCEKGLKVIMLERGRDIKHVTDYTNATKNPWDFPHRGRVDSKSAEEHFIGIRTGYTVNEPWRDMFEKDSENPIIEKKPIDWIRGYHVGGRSLMWGRQSYRWNEADFEANAKEGIATDWPIRYKDIAPWYDHVEKFAGISGDKDNIDVLPHGDHYLPAMNMNALEKDMKKRIEKEFPKRHFIMGRTAHLTGESKVAYDLGRSQCQFRNRCMMGCPYGGYFSTQSSTLPAAVKTGNLTLRPDAIVQEVIYDDKLGKAVGVRVIDQNTLQSIEYFAKVIFLNASAFGSTGIMLNSKSKRHPNGLGNESDQLGRNIMDHHLGVGANAEFDGMDDEYYYGRRANGIYIARYRNWADDKRDYTRGFGYQGGASREEWSRGAYQEGIGAEFKDSLSNPGQWKFGIMGFGEVLPNPENRMYLDETQKDKWGMPLLVFDAEYGANEKKMRIDMKNDAAEMLEKAGLKNVTTYDDETKHLGIGIHEMGTARMGTDAKNSCLNKNNQVWGAENVFVTDGAAMASASCVNPSLTYMALTARAADFAVSALKRGDLKA
jgi:choline dehydrogenase-like flavoprotein